MAGLSVCRLLLAAVVLVVLTSSASASSAMSVSSNTFRSRMALPRLTRSTWTTESNSEIVSAATAPAVVADASTSTTLSPTLASKWSFDNLPPSVKLLFGVGGIYFSFLYYGTLQEEVFHYRAADGTKFSQAWFLQALGKYILRFDSYLY